MWHGQPGGSWRLVVFFLKTTLKAISGNKAPSQHLARAPGGAAQPGPAAPSPLPSRHVTVNIAITSPSPSRHCGCWSHQLLAAPSSWSHSSAHEPHLYTYIYTYVCVRIYVSIYLEEAPLKPRSIGCLALTPGGAEEGTCAASPRWQKHVEAGGERMMKRRPGERLK